MVGGLFVMTVLAWLWLIVVTIGNRAAVGDIWARYHRFSEEEQKKVDRAFFLIRRRYRTEVRQFLWSAVGIFILAILSRVWLPYELNGTGFVVALLLYLGFYFLLSFLRYGPQRMKIEKKLEQMKASSEEIENLIFRLGLDSVSNHDRAPLKEPFA